MSGQRNTATSDICWAPQPGPQKALIDCPIYEQFYGGARGGGKTDGVLGKMGLKALEYGREFNAVMFRHQLPMLDDAIARSHSIYGPVGAVWGEQKKQWVFPGGGRLRFRPLETILDAEKYQGQNLTDCCIEEAGNYPLYAPIARLHGALRSGGKCPAQMHLTGNPGGPGQTWIRERYIDPHPHGMRPITESHNINGQTYSRQRVFIPAKVWDNPALLAHDPNYIANLHLVGSDALVRAWLDGDWNAVEGAFFDCWSSDIVIQPFEIPDDWGRFLAFDWGSAAPFVCQWWAIVGDDYIHQGQRLPRGAMICYREWYGASGPGVGLKLHAEEVTAGILERDSSVKVGYADPAIFAEDGGPSIAERMRPLIWRPADNRRIARKGALGGWDQMRARITDSMLFFFNTCTDSIRTIPTLQHDKLRPEDLDTNSDDHCADTCRYAVMSRPYTPRKERKAAVVHDYKFGNSDSTGWKTA